MDSDEWLAGAGQEGRLKWVPGHFQRGLSPAKGTAAVAVGSARLGCNPWEADLPSFFRKSFNLALLGNREYSSFQSTGLGCKILNATVWVNSMRQGTRFWL